MFEDTEVYPYRRETSPGIKPGPSSGARRVISGFQRVRLSPSRLLSRLRDAFSRVLTFEAAAICFAGFFLGRAVLLAELTPFAAAYAVAASRALGRTGVLAVPAVLAGLASVSSGFPLASSFLTVLGSWLLVRMVPREIRRPWLVLPVIVLSVTIVVKSSFAAFTEPTSYSYFAALFEAAFAAMLVPVLYYGLAALKKKAAGPGVHPFSGEEVFCILLICGGVIAGAGELNYGLVSLKGTLSRLVILLAAFMGGAGAGAGAGAVLGVIPGLSYTVVPTIIGAYAFTGLLAGISRNYGKTGVVTGFLLGNIILCVYIMDYRNMVSVLAETALAATLFFLVPLFLIDGLKVSLGLATEKGKSLAEKGMCLKLALEERVKNWARVLRELALTFQQASFCSASDPEEKALQRVINQVVKKVCSDCTFHRTCWEREFYKTYHEMVDLLALVEIHEKITPDDLPADLRRRCSRSKELAITVNCLYESYNLNRYWSRRLLENREIVAEQLKGISEVVAGLPDEISFESEAGEAGPYLRKKLKEAGIQVDSLTICRQENGDIEVYVGHAYCEGLMKCRDIIAPLLSGELEQPLFLASSSCTARENEHVCRLRLYPGLKYRLSAGWAGLGKNGSLLSGDNHAFLHLRGGQFGLVLSDGMGSGARAALESGTTISLLRHLLDLGFGQDLAIKTVNSILVLRSPGESFATVDLAVLNLYTGQASFVKIGAEPSFLLRDGHIDRIKANSLPVGIIEDIEVATLERTLEPGDVLVMVSDGILNACRGDGDREDWLEGILRDAASLPAGQMAELILKLAHTAAGGASRVQDDMTVLTVRLDKRKKRQKNTAQK